MPATLVGARYAVWFPGQTAVQSSNLAAQISWAVSGTNATLTFPGAGGSPAQITATVPAQPPLPPYAVAVTGISASSYQNASYPPTNAVDGIYTNFWVSYYGPTNNRAEWLQATFARQIALAEFKIYPRTNNNGYGPSSIMMFCKDIVNSRIDERFSAGNNEKVDSKRLRLGNRIIKNGKIQIVILGIQVKHIPNFNSANFKAFYGLEGVGKNVYDRIVEHDLPEIHLLESAK